MHAAKEGLQRELVEAHTEKQAVMQAGEVLLAELEQVHSARDDAVRKLTGIDGTLFFLQLPLADRRRQQRRGKQLHSARDNAVRNLTSLKLRNPWEPRKLFKYLCRALISGNDAVRKLTGARPSVPTPLVLES